MRGIRSPLVLLPLLVVLLGSQAAGFSVPVLAGLSLAPTVVGIGETSEGTVTLSEPADSGGVAVQIEVDPETAASADSSVVVPEGSSSTTFPIFAVENAAVTITATLGSTSESQVLTITDAAPALEEFTLTASVLRPGEEATGRVVLSGHVHEPASVDITITPGTAVAGPASVVVAAHQSSATFPITGVAAGEETVTASFEGVSFPLAVTVVNPSLAGLTVSSPTVAEGGGVLGSAMLDAPAPAGGLPVSLSSSHAAVSVPPHVVVPSGETTVAFAIGTGDVTKNVTATITGNDGSVTRSAVLQVLVVPEQKHLALKAKPRKVAPGSKVRLIAVVAPCEGHAGELVVFSRGAKTIAEKATDASCRAVRKVRVTRTSRFRAASPQQDEDHLAAPPAAVKIRVV